MIKTERDIVIPIDTGEIIQYNESMWGDTTLRFITSRIVWDWLWFFAGNYVKTLELEKIAVKIGHPMWDKLKEEALYRKFFKGMEHPIFILIVPGHRGVNLVDYEELFLAWYSA